MTDLFFIALLPPKEIAKKIIAIQKEVAEKYESKHALKSPPHITLIPPLKCNDDFKKIIIEPLTGFFRHYYPFNIQLIGFNCFERNRVVFINVTKNEQLDKLYNNLQNFADKNLKVQLQSRHEHFTPHLTIASRDLRKEMFPIAWNEFKEKTFEETWPASSAFLLRHSGKEWVPDWEFKFSEREPS